MGIYSKHFMWFALYIQIMGFATNGKIKKSNIGDQIMGEQNNGVCIIHSKDGSVCDACSKRKKIGVFFHVLSLIIFHKLTLNEVNTNTNKLHFSGKNLVLYIIPLRSSRRDLFGTYMKVLKRIPEL